MGARQSICRPLAGRLHKNIQSLYLRLPHLHWPAVRFSSHVFCHGARHKRHSLLARHRISTSTHTSPALHIFLLPPLRAEKRKTNAGHTVYHSMFPSRLPLRSQIQHPPYPVALQRMIEKSITILKRRPKTTLCSQFRNINVVQ